MELLMQEFHMYLLDIKSSPKRNREMSSIRFKLLTKTTWKLKTPGGILVFRVLVQVWQLRVWGQGRALAHCSAHQPNMHASGLPDTDGIERFSYDMWFF